MNVADSSVRNAPGNKVSSPCSRNSGVASTESKIAVSYSVTSVATVRIGSPLTSTCQRERWRTSR